MPWLQHVCCSLQEAMEIWGMEYSMMLVVDFANANFDNSLIYVRGEKDHHTPLPPLPVTLHKKKLDWGAMVLGHCFVFQKPVPMEQGNVFCPLDSRFLLCAFLTGIVVEFEKERRNNACFLAHAFCDQEKVIDI